MPTATSIGPAGASPTGRSVRQLARVVLGELPCHPARARAALQGPAQRIGARGLDLLAVAAEAAQPVRHDVEVIVLLERVEREPQPEAFGQRDLFLDRLARMQVAVVAVAV